MRTFEIASGILAWLGAGMSLFCFDAVIRSMNRRWLKVGLGVILFTASLSLAVRGYSYLFEKTPHPVLMMVIVDSFSMGMIICWLVYIGRLNGDKK